MLSISRNGASRPKDWQKIINAEAGLSLDSARWHRKIAELQGGSGGWRRCLTGLTTLAGRMASVVRVGGRTAWWSG